MKRRSSLYPALVLGLAVVWPAPPAGAALPEGKSCADCCKRGEGV